MTSVSFVLILTGGLQVILEFGSVTFIVISFLTAFANYKKRAETGSKRRPTIIALSKLALAGLLILCFEFTQNRQQLLLITCIYIILAIGAPLYSNKAIWKN